jgi:hypothetical protein
VASDAGACPVSSWSIPPSTTRGENRCRDASAPAPEGASGVRQAADEAALLEPGNQPVNAGFRSEAQRLLHLVERGGNAAHFHVAFDKAQQLELLFRQHRFFNPDCRTVVEQNINARLFYESSLCRSSDIIRQFERVN